MQGNCIAHIVERLAGTFSHQRLLSIFSTLSEKSMNTNIQVGLSYQDQCSEWPARKSVESTAAYWDYLGSLKDLVDKMFHRSLFWDIVCGRPLQKAAQKYRKNSGGDLQGN